MADTKEIRNKIGSIKNTQKITSAMEMVAASKMRKAQQRMEQSKPYFSRIRDVIGHLSTARPEYRHMYLEKREQIKRVGFIIVTSDRGLCGGLNVNLLKNTLKSMKDWNEKEAEIDLCLIGSKGASYFKRLNANVVAQKDHLGDAPSVNDLIGIVKVMLNDYEQGNIDAIYLCFNEFVNTMTQKPTIMPLLPIDSTQETENTSETAKLWDYIYEPDAKELINTLLIRYIESQVYQGVVENNACEQAARMVAMKSATDNAGDLINGLQLDLNKARQAAITQELSEIISGAAAV